MARIDRGERAFGGAIKRSAIYALDRQAVFEDKTRDYLSQRDRRRLR